MQIKSNLAVAVENGMLTLSGSGYISRLQITSPLLKYPP